MEQGHARAAADMLQVAYLISLHDNKSCSLSILLGNLLGFHSLGKLQVTRWTCMNFLLQTSTVSALGLSHLCETVLFFFNIERYSVSLSLTVYKNYDYSHQKIHVKSEDNVARHSLRYKQQQSTHQHAFSWFAA